MTNKTKDDILLMFQIVKDLKQIENQVHAFVKNKNNSFEDRLEVFVNTPKQFYTTKSWKQHFPEFEKEYGEIDWFDDFYFVKHEAVDLTELIKHKDEYSATEEWNDEKFRKFQEAILDKGIHEFTMDW